MITKTATDIVKTARVFNNYDRDDIPNADFMSDSMLDNKIRRAIRSKAEDTPTPMGKAVGGGAALGGLYGAVPGLLWATEGGRVPKSLGARMGSHGRFLVPTLAGAGLGALIGRGAKRADDRDISSAKKHLAKFDKYPTYREALRIPARANAVRDRDTAAHFEALSRNENGRAAREFMLEMGRQQRDAQLLEAINRSQGR